MSEEVAGQNGLDTTIGGITNVIGSSSTVPTGKTDELQEAKAQLAEAIKQIERLKGTQSANDRALASAKSQLDQMAVKTAEYESAVKARDASITIATGELDALKTKTAELDKLQAQAAAAQTEIERLKIVAEYSAQNPMIAVLVKANALPRTSTIDEFRQAIQTIVDGVGSTANHQVLQTLAGARKPPTPAGEDAASLQEEATKLIRQGRDEEGYALWRRALALQASQ
jgi:chromosome segregation ATPase